MADTMQNDIRLLLAALAFVALFALKGALTAPPAPATAGPGEFDAARAIARLVLVLGDERPHPVDSDANDAVRDRIVAEIRAIGHEPEIRDDFSCRLAKRWNSVACARVRNIVFRAGPAGPGGVLIATHYDSVAAGPGAADAGAGVAVALEIASLLEARTLSRPVIFLISDGEETSLLGAEAFAKGDPYRGDVAAIINLEARGVSGPAIFFETSEKNSRDVRAFARTVPRPVGNSVATGVYKRLPNDTDASALRPLGADLVNLAFTERVALYHTPGDSLANLNPASLGHLGASALGALDGFLSLGAAEQSAPETGKLFADLFGRVLLVIPEPAGFGLLGAGLVAAFLLFVRSKDGPPLRAAIAPLAAAALAGLIAFAALALIGAARQESAPWQAHPLPARIVIYASAAVGVVFALSFVAGAQPAPRTRLLAASWATFGVFGLAAAIVEPGAALMVGAPAFVFALAALSSFALPRIVGPLSLLGAALALGLWATALHHAESALGFGAAAVFAPPAALLFMLVATAVAGRPDRRRLVNGATALMLIAAVGAALFVPAYSPAAPRPLNIQHVTDTASGEAFWRLTASDDGPPTAMAALAPFKQREIAGLSGERPVAAAPALDEPAPQITSTIEATPDGRRRARLAIAANGADEIIIIIPEAADAAAARIAGVDYPFSGSGGRVIRCVGRACASFEIEAQLGADPSDFLIIARRYGLGPAGAALIAARPAWASPVHEGDSRLILVRRKI